jgi:hypothetical protein
VYILRTHLPHVVVLNYSTAAKFDHGSYQVLFIQRKLHAFLDDFCDITINHLQELLFRLDFSLLMKSLQYLFNPLQTFSSSHTVFYGVGWLDGHPNIRDANVFLIPMAAIVPTTTATTKQLSMRQ